MVQANPETVQAAERLGLELPADVFSENTQLRNLTGLARSQPGTSAQASWQTTVADSAKQVEDALSNLGATRDLTQLSDDVFRRLNGNMEILQKQGEALRQGVDDALNVQSRVNSTNVQRELAQTINDLGGIEEATQAMSGPERKLLAALGVGKTPRNPTYAFMERLRREMGDALNARSGPWADVDRTTLNRYYAALADDRIAHVGRELGEEAANRLAASNEIFTGMFAAREAMQQAFGKNLDRSIGGMIRGAVGSANRGSATDIRRLLAQVPEDMRAEVAISGILNNSIATGGGRSGFSFTRFANTINGLRANSPVWRELRQAMTPEQNNLLKDLYVISRQVADAEGRIERTGRALAPMAKAINAEGLVEMVLNHGVPRAAASMATGVGTGAVGGPIVGMAAGMATETAIRTILPTASRLDRVAAVIGSAQFRDVVTAASSGVDPVGPINRLAGSRVFVGFGRAMGLETHRDRVAWIRSALVSGSSTARTAINDNGGLPGRIAAQEEQKQQP
jgi:hypothetical protein